MSNRVPDYIFMRSFPHSNSQKKIVNRTKDDNAENEYTSETFKNRKGGLHNIIDSFSDEFPNMTGKKEPKKNKGLRKFKGAETIRKPKNDEED